MRRDLLGFDIDPRPAKEGQTIKITFKNYPIKNATVKVRVVGEKGEVDRYIKILVRGGQGEAVFRIPKGWGPVLFLEHRDFVSGAVSVNR